MKGKWLLQLSSKSLLSMNIQVLARPVRTRLGSSRSVLAASVGIGPLRGREQTFACAELPRHSLDHDRGPGASEAGRFSLHQSPPSAELTLRRILWRPHSLVSQVLDSGEDVPELLRREWESDESGKSRW
jgi:hypothetical protein